ncbi:MAG: hypothetical protein JNK58_01050 [Phycisphaerae bacterium]|nr:hypothetical protein [Phycisphaerae bacterium]
MNLSIVSIINAPSARHPSLLLRFDRHEAFGLEPHPTSFGQPLSNQLPTDPNTGPSQYVWIVFGNPERDYLW